MKDDAADVDPFVEDDWRGFQNALADHLAALEPGDSVRVSGDTAGAARDLVPEVVVDHVGAGIRLRLIATPAGDHRPEFDDERRRRLAALGLLPPDTSDSDFHAIYDANHVDEVAYVVVRIYREVYEIPLTAYLHSADLDWSLRVDSVPDLVDSDTEPEPVRITDPHQLEALVGDVIGRMIGKEPIRDDDGDIPLVAGTGVVFVSTIEDLPLVRVFAEMVVDIEDMDAALHEVAILNQQIHGVKFTLVGDKIVASDDLLCSVFVAEHLEAVVAHLCEVVSSNDGTLARRVRGRTFLDPDSGRVEPDLDEAEPDDTPATAVPLLQLEAAGPTALKPKVLAALCEHDPEIVLDLIRWNQDEESRARDARSDAKLRGDRVAREEWHTELVRCRRRARVLEKTLRRVLRD